MTLKKSKQEGKVSICTNITNNEHEEEISEVHFAVIIEHVGDW